MKIYCMFGLPGAGKSSWIKENLPGVEVIGKDLIREELGIIGPDGKKAIGTAAQERQIKAIETERIQELIRARKDFAIDNLNLANPADLMRRLRAAGAKEDEIVAVKIDTDPRVCIQRRRGDIPPIAIWRYHKLFRNLDLSMYKQVISVPGE